MTKIWLVRLFPEILGYLLRHISILIIFCQKIYLFLTVCEWWKDLHAWCEPECMTYLQSKPILTSMGIGMATPMSMSPSSSCASEETCSTEDYFNKDIHQGIVNTMKQLQRGAKSISVTFSTIDKYVKQEGYIQNKHITLPC